MDQEERGAIAVKVGIVGACVLLTKKNQIFLLQCLASKKLESDTSLQIAPKKLGSDTSLQIASKR